LTRRFWAPGRVNLIGEFTDLAGGLALPAAIDLGITIEGERAGTIDLHSPVQGFERYVDAVAHELELLGRPPVGLRGEVFSTLPMGAGLSSSAAFEVAVAVALCGIAGFELEPMELAQAARRAEHRASGVPSGILDQAASVLGRAGHAVLLDFATLEHELVQLPDGVSIVIVESGVTRQHEHSGYATRKRELEEGMPSRVRHIETENERVRAVVEALRADDLARVGELFREGHESLRVDFEATIPALDRLVDLAYAHGALAARMTGGGFGGAIVALIAAEDTDAFASHMPGRAHVAAASDGAREL